MCCVQDFNYYAVYFWPNRINVKRGAQHALISLSGHATLSKNSSLKRVRIDMFSITKAGQQLGVNS